MVMGGRRGEELRVNFTDSRKPVWFLVEKCNQDYNGEQPECLPHSRDPDGQHRMLKIRSHGVRAFADIVSFDNLMEFIFL